MYSFLRAIFGKSVDMFLSELSPLNSDWIRRHID
jgi:hypothetical protein